MPAATLFNAMRNRIVRDALPQTVNAIRLQALYDQAKLPAGELSASPEWPIECGETRLRIATNAETPPADIERAL